MWIVSVSAIAGQQWYNNLMREKAKIVYRFKDNLYINLTNRCPNACSFCIKTKFSMVFEGYNLNLEGKEPSAEEVLAEIRRQSQEGPVGQIVFCGYGEPTMRLAVLLEVASVLKEDMALGKYPKTPIRLNTLGLGNLVYGRDITGDLAKVLDSVSISINSPSKEQWLEVVRPQPQYRERGYESVLEFIRLLALKMQDVTVTIVDRLGIDVEETEKLARSLGAKFRVREFIA